MEKSTRINPFTPIQLGHLTLKNRVIFPAMCNYYSDEEGFVTRQLEAFVQARAKGGTSLFILPGSPHGKPSAARPALSDEKYLDGWRRLGDICHAEDCKLFVQLHPAKHQAGRDPNLMLPDHMLVEVIEELVESYAQGALRVKKANLDGVEIHGAHAHEVAQFMSPYYNHREDSYGGSPEKRAFFPSQIVSRIKEICGDDFPVIFKISSSEMISGGREIDETVQICQVLEKAGVDAFDVSVAMPESEAYISGPMDLPDAFNLSHIYQVKQSVHVPVIAINRINTPELAEKILAEEKADIVAIGRGQLADPDFVNKMISGEPINYCVGCNQGCRASITKKSIFCMQNPVTGRESTLTYQPVSDQEKPKKILVAGGGPSGLEAALVLAKRGYQPILCERSDKLGGLINYAVLPPHKASMTRVVDYRKKMLEKYGVEVRLGCTVTPELVDIEQVEHVIVATGSLSQIPPIPGIHQSNSYTIDEIFNNSPFTGKHIAVIGGGLNGCEVAEYLVANGNTATVIEMEESVATGLNKNRRYFLIKRLKEAKVEIHVNTKVKSIALPDIQVETENQIQTLSGFDGVVVATGRKPNQQLAEAIEKHNPKVNVHVVGDAKTVGMALDAIWDGATLGANI